MTDKIIQCSRCKGDLCYETDHTFSNELNIKSWICMGCGFTSNSTLNLTDENLIQTESLLPELYKDIKFIDDEGFVWFPSVMNYPDLGVVFVNGTTKDNWSWAAIKNIPVEENEKHKYPIPGTDKFSKFKSDMESLKEFGQKGFMDALEYINFFNKSFEK
jgi:hypothetical protein